MTATLRVTQIASRADAALVGRVGDGAAWRDGSMDDGVIAVLASATDPSPEVPSGVPARSPSPDRTAETLQAEAKRHEQDLEGCCALATC